MSDVPDGAAVLDNVAKFIDQYVIFPSEHCLTAVTLWAAHTHAVERFYITPRLILDSAEPGSGKTRVLELLHLLCPMPELILSPTTAAIFRMLVDGPVTLLFDETDAIFNLKNAGNYEDLRGLLNAGYKRGATIPRCVGDAANMRVHRFPVFAPVVLAGLAGHMPRTVLTRAVVIHMRRRAPGEKVTPYYEQDAEEEAEELRARVADWVNKVSERLGGRRPNLPEGVEDRPAEVWATLVAVADAAGGEWPKKARAACKHFVLQSDPGQLSLGQRLLADVRDLYTAQNVDRMATTVLIDRLTALDEAPWADLHGKPLDPRRLSVELGKYGVKPTTFDTGDKSKAKGYVTYGTAGKAAQAGLADAWARYLPALIGNPRNSGNRAGQMVTDENLVTDGSVTDADQVTDDAVTGSASVTALTREVTAVTGVTDSDGCRDCGGTTESRVLAMRDGRCITCDQDHRAAS